MTETLMQRIRALLERADGDSPVFPPTLLFNENWLLRIVLDWFSGHREVDSAVASWERAQWFSEALLPSAFLPRCRGDRLAESWTHADGVVGHFQIGSVGRGDLTLLQDARQFVVIEGKMLSRLSSGVKNVPYFDQAARNVACMAEVLRRGRRSPSMLGRLAFYVVAPEIQISRGAFPGVNQESIRRKVQRRVREYQGERDEWHREWFSPTAEHIVVGCLSWESIIEEIGRIDAADAKAPRDFYGACLKYNAGARSVGR